MDAISFAVLLFDVFVLFVGGLILVAFLLALFRRNLSGAQPDCSSTNQETSSPDSETEKDTAEDSEGDGLMLFDDPMFPPEFNDDEDDP